MRYIGEFKPSVSGFLIEYQGERIFVEKESEVTREINRLLSIMPYQQNYMSSVELRTFVFSDNPADPVQPDLGLRCKETTEFIQNHK